MPCDEDAGCPSEPLTVDALRRHDERERHTQALQLEDQYECIMCCETIPVSHLTILPCGHEFHAECIRNWVYHRREGGPRYPGGQSKCPLCRRSLLYLCKHRISKYLLRPGVQIHPLELMTFCPNWIWSTAYPHEESVPSEDEKIESRINHPIRTPPQPPLQTAPDHDAPTN
ncbi:hypothetical protein F4821DRAFT_12181 [Hypoxylon rubiginosum]|uniref:Uncharacterized protein n=1 Tax=Hypoxylon rubiginosum TaxID=110542 RepID=A0ACC0DDQ8_9PEZI|nr:hypothetical protein F4821DRAFT_12181 [Hypoxylon rubiginosum]